MRSINQKYIRAGLAGIASAALMAPSASAFGGEDIKAGRPWHHLDMTLRALAGDEDAGAGVTDAQFEGAGFSRGAAMSIAWHADYIDSYLYNPLWWLQGFPEKARFKASLAQFDHLAAMHHDDTFTTAGIVDNWDRYTSGLLVGLNWAAEKGDVNAGHQLLGIASHAVQDFYSHSNWIDDPARRQTTWFEIRPQDRSRLNLYTGAYELPSGQAPHHHGAYSASCTVLRQADVGSSLQSLCGGYSPIQNTSLCTAYRDCDGATEVSMSGLDVAVDDLVYLQPAGIAMDTTRVSRIGGKERGLVNGSGNFTSSASTRNMDAPTCAAVVNFGVECDHDTAAEVCSRGGQARSCTRDIDYLFADTKMLATRTTTQYMQFIETAMKAMDPSKSCDFSGMSVDDCADKYEAYWQRVKTQRSSMSYRTRQFEDFEWLPFQFMSAGPYPVRNASTSHHPYVASSDGWYMRVRIKTSRDRLSGTDADIKMEVKGDGYTRTVLLDYLPTDDNEGRTNNRFLVYNDFESGDNDVYTIGPFPARPTQARLINSSANGKDVAKAAWDGFKTRLDHRLTDARRTLISIVGGNADYVGASESYLSFADMAQYQASGRTGFSMTVDGGDEGKYRLPVTLSYSTSGLTADQKADGWKRVTVTLSKLACIKESKVDRGSSSDEPFIFFSAAALNGLASNQVWAYRTNPFSDVDTGESRNLGGNRSVQLSVPPQGGIAMAFQVWESDAENSNDRNQLFTTFKTGIDEETRRENGKFLDKVGAAVAADWKVDEVEIDMFHRVKRPEMIASKVWKSVGWIEGGESRTFNLTGGSPRPVVASASIGDVSTWYVSPALDYTGLVRRTQTPVNVGTLKTAQDKMVANPTIIANRKDLKPLLVQGGPWQGTWNSNFGELRLVQTGDTVTGDYADRGVIDATFDSDTSTLTGTFTNGANQGELTMTLNDGTFAGQWRWAGDSAWRGEWTGTRESAGKPELKNK